MKTQIKESLVYLLLSILAMFLQRFFSPIAWVITVFRIAFSKEKGWKDLKQYFLNVAVSYDQTANAENGVIYNDIMITKMSLNEFGFPDETLSSVFGKNKRVDTLTKFGNIWAWLLNKIEHNHVEMAIEEDEGNSKN
jgi:8-oxo-dGTP diphosphatase